MAQSNYLRKFVNLLDQFRKDIDYGLIKTLLYAVGLWPPAHDIKKSRLDQFLKIYTTFMLISGVLSTTVLFPIRALLNQDLATVVDCVGFTFIESMVLVKGGCFYFRADQVRNLTSTIQLSKLRTRSVWLNQEAQQIVAATRKWTNILIYLAVGIVAFVLIAHVFQTPHMLANRIHFFRFWFPIDQYTSPTYEIMFVFWLLRIALASPIVMFTDAYIATTFLQIINQFQLINHDLKHLREVAVESVCSRWQQREAETDVSCEESSDDLPSSCQATEIPSFEQDVDEEMRRSLGDCVERNQESIQMVKEMETTFAPILMNQLVCSVVTLVAGIFVLSEDTNSGLAEEKVFVMSSFNKIATFIVFILCSCAELWMYCFLADLINEQSDLVREAAYSCDWFEESASFKRSMRVMMSRSNQPLVITIAGFVPLSQETFLGIMNLAYSYYMAMKTAVHGLE